MFGKDGCSSCPKPDTIFPPAGHFFCLTAPIVEKLGNLWSTKQKMGKNSLKIRREGQGLGLVISGGSF